MDWYINLKGIIKPTAAVGISKQYLMFERDKNISKKICILHLPFPAGVYVIAGPH